MKQDTYKPSALRKRREETPRATKYGIGISIDQQDFGMTFGPVDDVMNCLEEIGQENAYILRFNSNGTNTVLWKWNDEDDQWEKA